MISGAKITNVTAGKIMLLALSLLYASTLFATENPFADQNADQSANQNGGQNTNQNGDQSADHSSNKVELKQLMLTLSKVTSTKASFVETKTMKLLKKPLVLTGQLVYKAPDYLQKKVKSPTPSTFTINGQRVKAEELNKELREFSLDESILLQALVESLRATLSGNLGTLRDFYEVSASGTYASWTLELEPIDDDVKIYIRHIQIAGQNTNITRIDTVESNNDRSVMSITPLN